MGFPPGAGGRGDPSASWNLAKRTRERRSGSTPRLGHATCPSPRCNRWELCDELQAKEFKCQCGCHFAKGLASPPRESRTWDQIVKPKGEAKAKAGGQDSAAAAEVAGLMGERLRGPDERGVEIWQMRRRARPTHTDELDGPN